MTLLLQLGLVLAVPALALWLGRTSSLARRVGPVVLCYVFGVLARNLPGLPWDAELIGKLAEGAVLLAVPLLLLPTDLRRFGPQARTTLPAFACACAGSVLGGLLVGTLLSGRLAGIEHVAAMLVGTYIGGIANMNAIGLALEVSRELLVNLNAADMLIGGVWLFVMLTVAHRVLRWLLPWSDSVPPPTPGVEAPGTDPVGGGWPGALPVLGALGAGAGIVLGSVGLVWLVLGALEPVPVLLALTTLGLGGSFLRPLRTLGAAMPVGEYAMLAFCFCIGSLVDVRLLAASSPVLIGVCAAVMGLGLAVQVALARLFRLEAAVVLVTSTAALFGPAFVPAVARAIGRDELLAPGVTVGLLGFALGTYLGLGTAWLLGG
jgi:uncharacterized membrane protein